MTNIKKSYNCLGCPQCSGLLYDPLYVLEHNAEVKTIKCENCDFVGYRKGWNILNKIEENEYKNSIIAKRNGSKQSNSYDRVRTASALY